MRDFSEETTPRRKGRQVACRVEGTRGQEPFEKLAADNRIVQIHRNGQARQRMESKKGVEKTANTLRSPTMTMTDRSVILEKWNKKARAVS